MITSTDGYKVSVIGPFFADGKNSDAYIQNIMLKYNVEGMFDWLNKDDIFIFLTDGFSMQLKQF